MKNKILKILNEVQQRPEFNGCKYSLTVNYESVLDYPYKTLGDDTFGLFDEVLSKSDIENFNFTVMKGTSDNNDDWYSVSLVFYGGVNLDPDDYPKIKNLDEFGRFDFRYLGQGTDFKVRNELLTYPGPKSHNSFRYDKVGDIIDLSAELFNLLRLQYIERKAILKKYKTYNED